MPTDPTPTAPRATEEPTLEERARTLFDAALRGARIASKNDPFVEVHYEALLGTADDLSRLRAEVERLTAERDEALRADDAEARAARLEGVVRELAADDPEGIAADEEPTCRYCHCGYEREGPDWILVLLHAADCMWLRARATLTEGGDHGR